MAKKEDRRARRKAHKKLRRGKSARTAAGPFVHQEIKHYQKGKHGQSRKQAVAVGISKARRHGVPYPQRGQGGRGGEKTKKELYEQAKRKGIEGRSKMDKGQLQRALKKAA